jgi:hypothetical protein
MVSRATNATTNRITASYHRGDVVSPKKPLFEGNKLQTFLFALLFHLLKFWEEREQDEYNRS